LLLRGEEGECDPAFASKEDRDVALPFSDLGLCLGSCTCNPTLQEDSYWSHFCCHNFYIFDSLHKKVSPWRILVQLGVHCSQQLNG